LAFVAGGLPSEIRACQPRHVRDFHAAHYHLGADTEMIVDATISVLNASGIRRYQNIAAAGGSTVRTAHLEKGRPTGGNVCFLDNHVVWRNYATMTNRISPRGLPQFEF
jgi:hypothetical protein